MARLSAVAVFLLALIVSSRLIWQPSQFKAVFFDVGEGASTFIETPERFQVLIDGGPSSKVVTLLGQEMPFYDHFLDLVVLTHFDRDHLYGLLEVIKRYQIGRVLVSGGQVETQVARLFKQALENRALEAEIADADSDFQIGQTSFDFLSPAEAEWDSGLSENDLSLVLYVNYEDLDLLLMADASSQREERLLNLWPDVEVLQVSHHGSSSSTSQLFLQKITPLVAVIPVGKNSYGHPDQSVLDRLSGVGARVLRTDQQGTIRLFIKDNQIKIRTER